MKPATQPRPRPATEHSLVSFREVQHIAQSVGVKIRRRTFGPFYRITLSPQAAEVEREVYGTSDGFVLPFLKYMHCDTIHIYSAQVMQNAALRERRLLLGLLMGAATFSYAFERGCLHAECLAINDNDITARRLVLFYRYFGFEAVREIEGGWGDLFEMLMWGGVGTKLSASIPAILHKWTPFLREVAKR